MIYWKLLLPWPTVSRRERILSDLVPMTWKDELGNLRLCICDDTPWNPSIGRPVQPSVKDIFAPWKLLAKQTTYMNQTLPSVVIVHIYVVNIAFLDHDTIGIGFWIHCKQTLTNGQQRSEYLRGHLRRGIQGLVTTYPRKITGLVDAAMIFASSVLCNSLSRGSSSTQRHLGQRRKQQKMSDNYSPCPLWETSTNTSVP